MSLKVKREDLVETRKVGDIENKELPPHIVRMPKGAVPEYISLNPLQKTAWKFFGKKASEKYKAKHDTKMEEDLLKAHILLRPDEFLAYVYFISALMVIVGIALAVFLALLGNILLMIIGFVMVPVLPLMVSKLMMAMPSSAASKRGKDIDSRMGYAMNFIAAMASADVTIDVIFKELAQRDEYGEIKNEAEWITRDTELLGKDILTALKDAAKRSPSTKLQDFLQGVVTTATSGGRLKPFFVAKSQELEQDMRLGMKKKMETLALFAETYVTVGVAFPLFLVVIMAIMALIGGSGSAEGVIMVLNILVYVMIPALIGVFIFIIHNTSKEVA